MIDVRTVRRVALALAVLGVALAILGMLPGEYVATFDGAEDVIPAGGWPLVDWVGFVLAGAAVIARDRGRIAGSDVEVGEEPARQVAAHVGVEREHEPDAARLQPRFFAAPQSPEPMRVGGDLGRLGGREEPARERDDVPAC